MEPPPRAPSPTKSPIADPSTSASPRVGRTIPGHHRHQPWPTPTAEACRRTSLLESAIDLQKSLSTTTPAAPSICPPEADRNFPPRRTRTPFHTRADRQRPDQLRRRPALPRLPPRPLPPHHHQHRLGPQPLRLLRRAPAVTPADRPQHLRRPTHPAPTPSPPPLG